MPYAQVTKEMQVGQLKARFSQVLDQVIKGEETAISYGRIKETIAVIVPYSRYSRKKTRRIGLYEGKSPSAS